MEGCAVQKKDGTMIKEEDFQKGTDSLSMEFLGSAPPSKVFSTEKNNPQSGIFDVGLKISNKGASDINSGVISLSLETGYVNDIGKYWESSDPRFSSRYKGNSVTYSLRGKSSEVPAGESIILSKILQANIPDVQSETRKSTIIATACYDYKTKKVATVCIEPKSLAERIGPKPCEVKDLAFDSQGAPLAVTKISPRMTLMGELPTVEFLIYIKNKGQGQIVPYNKIAEACEPKGGEKGFWNTINEEDFKIAFSTGEGKFKCGPFPMKLTGKDEDFIRCIYDSVITSQQAYSTTLNLEFNYGYTQSISKDITIERPPEVKAQ